MKKIFLFSFLLFGLFSACENKKPEQLIENIVVQDINEATTDTPIQVQEEISKYHFTKIYNLKVLDKVEKGTSIDSLNINTKVKILEEISVGEKTPTLYSKIQYKKNNKTSEGWVLNSSLTDNIKNNLPSSWGSLDFSPQLKKNYKSNPQIVVKGIFVTGNSISSTKSLDRLIELTKKSEINTFVIDVKDDDGHLLWEMPDISDKYNLKFDKKNKIRDIESLMKKLKENNIYTIARIVSFKDPIYAKSKPDRTILDKRSNKPFTNADGLVWVSAHDRELWNYNIDVSKEAAKVGFNEIQFDYVRFPASNGGKLDKHLNYRNPEGESKPEAIQKYLKLAHKELAPLEVYIGADVYGQVGSSPNDMDLGQHWESISNVVDYISPMVYPSHYGKGVYGISVPDAQPYKTVYGSTRDSLNRNYNIETPALIRTWLQDFSAPWVKGHIKYGVKEVNEQIRALNSLGIHDYILWNASNRYSFEKKEKK
ncbi:MAG: putative glycoside hydrolase [Fusobacteriaceae bacterium]